MTAPLRSFYTDFGRFYQHPSSGVSSSIGQAAYGLDGEGPFSPKPSVTNIISLMNEDFLPKYYARLVATYAAEHLAEISYQAEKFGNDVVIGTLQAVPNRPHPSAAIGDEVHAAIDGYFHGELPESFQNVTSQHMFERFVTFMDAEKPNVTYTEFTVWSYSHGYAGTGDLMWVDSEGKLWIVDTKTGSSIWPKVAMQCIALARADVLLEADGTETPMPKVDKIGVLHLRPRSAKLFELQHADEAFNAFLGLKAAFDWKRHHASITIPEKPHLQA